MRKRIGFSDAAISADSDCESDKQLGLIPDFHHMRVWNSAISVETTSSSRLRGEMMIGFVVLASCVAPYYIKLLNLVIVMDPDGAAY